MPRIPTLTQNQTQLNPLPSVQVQYVRSTAGESIGNALNNVADVGATVQRQERIKAEKLAKEEQLKADQIAFMETDRQLGNAESRLLHDPQSGAFTRRGKDAFDITNTTLAEFDKAASEAEKALTSDRQILAYRKSTQDRRQAIERQLQQFEYGQREQYYANERDAYKKAAIDAGVTNYTDPKRIAEEQARIRATVEMTPGLSPEAKAQQTAELTGAMNLGIIDRYLTNNRYAEGKKYFDSVRATLGADGVIRAETALATARKRIEAEAKEATVNKYAANIMREYTSYGPEAGAAALEKLSNSGLPPDVQRQVYTAVNADQARQREIVQSQHAGELADIYRNIGANTATGQTQIDTDLLWNKGAFTPAEYASLSSRIDESRRQAMVDAALAGTIRQALEAGTPLDPNNANVMKALSATFAADTTGVEVGSQSWQAAASAYATRARVLPEQASTWARLGLRSPDPAVAAKAAQFLGGVDATAGDAYARLDADTKAMAGMINSMIAGGTSPEKAAEIARERLIDANPAMVAARQKQFTENLNGPGSAIAKQSTSILRGLVDDDFDPSIFGSAPEITQALDVDFRGQLEKYYVKTGDLDLAKSMAWSDLKRVYGPTKVNGRSEMMAFPPERFGITPEEVKTDLSAFLAKNPQADGSTADDIKLVPDSLTMRQIASVYDGQPVLPSYRVVTKSGDLLTDANHTVIRYVIPQAEELAKKIQEARAKAEADAQQMVDEARRARDSHRQRIDRLNRGEGLH